MNEEKQRYLWSCILVDYFTSQGYSKVNIAGRRTKKDEIEVWMIALENKKYNMIHITSSFQQAENDYLNEMCNAMEEALNEPIKVLNINLFKLETPIYYTQFIESIDLLPDNPIDEKYTIIYPGLDKLLYYSNDVDKEINNTISKTIKTRKSIMKERRKKSRVPSGLMFKIVASICILVYLAITITNYKYEDANLTSITIAYGAYYKTFITCLKQYYRFLTSGFVHSGLLHLLCNLYALLQIGKIVEKEYGFTKSIIILLSGIIFGNIFVFIIKGNIVAYGLSGGINALFGALVATCFVKGYYKEPNVRNSLITNLVLNLAISFMPNISLTAHLGGLVIGAFEGVILCAATSKSLRINFVISLIIGIIATGILMYKENDIDDYYTLTDYQVIQMYQKVHLSDGKELDILNKYYKGVSKNE